MCEVRRSWSAGVRTNVLVLVTPELRAELRCVGQLLGDVEVAWAGGWSSAGHGTLCCARLQVNIDVAGVSSWLRGERRQWSERSVSESSGSADQR